MEIKIEKLVFEGFGLGHEKGDRSFDGVYNEPAECAQDFSNRKKAIFVLKAVPGDILDVEIVKDKKNYAEGIIKEIIKPSPNRIQPKCKYFDKCGGCESMNISYKDQLKFKEEVFVETLKRQGVDIVPEKIIAGSNSEYFYRNSIRFFFLHLKDNKISFGRHNYQYNKGFVEVDNCFLQSKTTNQILTSLKECLNEDGASKTDLWQLKIREGKFTGEFMVEIITTSHELPCQKEIVDTLKNIAGIKSIFHTIAPAKSLKNMKRRLIFGSPVIFEKIGKFKFQISPESFFQTNSLGVHTLYEKIKEYAGVKFGDNILDLYCGTGTIGIYLSTLAKKVTGVEIVPEAIRDAKDNAKINHVNNCEFINIAAEKIFSNPLLLQPKAGWPLADTTSCQLLILDPPRAGLSKEVILEICNKLRTDNCPPALPDAKHLRAGELKTIVYVSCNPATFARDVKIFEENSCKLIKVQPIDMFPQTHHIECVGLISTK